MVIVRKGKLVPWENQPVSLKPTNVLPKFFSPLENPDFSGNMKA
jgi:hypothetical protein